MPVIIPRPTAVRVGFILFAVGLVFLVVTILPYFWGSHDRPVWLNVGCMLAPIGFITAVTGVFRASRAEQRAAAAELSD
jgi:uncharacterized membrane protein YhdT